MDNDKKIQDYVAASTVGSIEMYGSPLGYLAEITGICGMMSDRPRDVVAGMLVYLSGRLLVNHRQRLVARRELDERIMNSRYDLDSKLEE